MKYFRIFLFVLFSIPSLTLYSQPSGYKISRQEYIERYKAEAIRSMEKHGIPASITLAQGILESGDGNSALAKFANNHFGIKCHKDWKGETFIQDDDEKNECFRKYNSPEESFYDHSVFLKRPRYASLFELSITDYKGWAHGLKQAGYATNPKYPELLIKIIEDNKLFEYDNNSAVTAKNKEEFKITPTSNAITEPSGREIKLLNNIKHIIAQVGDTPEKIAGELNMRAWQIYKYNELSKGEKVNPGDIVFLQPKRNKNKGKEHIAGENETVQTISQLYGVKKNKIYQYNNLSGESTRVEKGQRVLLYKQSRF
jgi:LysM repeat protein